MLQPLSQRVAEAFIYQEKTDMLATEHVPLKDLHTGGGGCRHNRLPQCFIPWMTWNDLPGYPQRGRFSMTLALPEF